MNKKPFLVQNTFYDFKPKIPLFLFYVSFKHNAFYYLDTFLVAIYKKPTIISGFTCIFKIVELPFLAYYKLNAQINLPEKYSSIILITKASIIYSPPPF